MISELTKTLLRVFLFPLLVWILINRKQSLRNLPPGPPKLPVIGNLHQLSSLPHRSLIDLSRRYGPIMFLQFGSIPAVVISSADIAREILKNQDTVFANRPATFAVRKFSYNCSDITFGEYGVGWNSRKKMVTRELLSMKKVQSFQSLRMEEVDFMVDRVSRSDIINFDDLTLNLANNFVSRAAFGKRSDEESAAGGRNKFHEAIRDVQFLAGGFCVGDLFPWLGWFNKMNGFEAKVEKRFKELDELYNKIIEEHSQPDRTKLEQEEDDLVDVLLRLQKDQIQDITLTDNQIKGVITDTFNAGTDTASGTLVWIMSELIKNPVTMKKAQNEIREAVKGNQKVEEDDLSKLPYLKAIIKEGLRLHPPLPLLVPREAIHDSVVMGYCIPAKTTVFINALAIATDPKVWVSPNEFRPERFLDCFIDYKGLDFELLPFGSGRRGCPGIRFGMVLIELVLANLLYRFDWELPLGMKRVDVDMEEVYGLSIHKKLPLFLVATPINV